MMLRFFCLVAVAAAVAILGPGEMANVERCEGTPQQCRKL
jgi:hypothetical protein